MNIKIASNRNRIVYGIVIVNSIATEISINIHWNNEPKAQRGKLG